MRIGRKIIIPAIVSLSAAGAIFASTAVAATAAQATTTTSVSAGSSAIYFHG